MAGNKEGPLQSDSESDYSSEDSSLSSSECSNAAEISPAHIQLYSLEPRFEVDALEEDEEMHDAEEMPRRVNNLDW